MVSGLHFESLWALAIVLLIPAALYVVRRRRRASLRFSSAAHAARSGRSLRQRLGATPLVLRVVGLALLALALARPQRGIERTRDTSKGIAIMAVLDRSGSMQTELDYRGEHLTRLEAAKRVFEEFVTGEGGDLAGRPNDLVGLIAFADFAETICPLTLAHGALSHFLGTLRTPEGSTNIGDALALAAARLKTAEQSLAEQSPDQDKTYEIKSKVIILLTDGRHVRGKRTPQEGAELARKWGIKVHTIGLGGDYVTIDDPIFGRRLAPAREPVDMATLEAVAEATGGIARRAEDAEALRAVYQEIDQLEKSEVESFRYLDYRELFPWLALPALVVLFIETTLSCTVFRRIP